MYPYFHSLYSDLVFILLDKPDESHDRMISEHIMRTHALAGNKTSKRREDKGGADGTGTGTGTRGSQGPTPPVEEEEIGQSTLSQRLRRFAGLYEDGSNSDSHQSHGDDGTLRFVYSVTCRTYISTTVKPPDLLQLMLLSCYSYLSMSYTHTVQQNVSLSTEVMRKYIEYARRYCNPVLTKAAAKVHPICCPLYPPFHPFLSLYPSICISFSTHF